MKKERRTTRPTSTVDKKGRKKSILKKKGKRTLFSLFSCHRGIERRKKKEGKRGSGGLFYFLKEKRTKNDLRKDTRVFPNSVWLKERVTIHICLRLLEEGEKEEKKSGERRGKKYDLIRRNVVRRRRKEEDFSPVYTSLGRRGGKRETKRPKKKKTLASHKIEPLREKRGSRKPRPLREKKEKKEKKGLHITVLNSFSVAKEKKKISQQPKRGRKGR